MKHHPLRIHGALLVEPAVHRDERGSFHEVWRESFVRELGGPDCRIVQVNRSRSLCGVLRGLHYQAAPRAQAKLVTVLAGSIYDVIVDLRAGSPTFGQWEGLTLEAERMQQVWIPAGCAHGFLVLSDHADCEYACSESYDPASERTIRWDDPDLAIAWPIEAGRAPVLSARDQAGAAFKDLPA